MIAVRVLDVKGCAAIVFEEMERQQQETRREGMSRSLSFGCELKTTMSDKRFKTVAGAVQRLCKLHARAD